MCNKKRLRASINQLGKAMDKQLQLPLTRFTNEPIPQEVFPRRPGLILRPIDPLNPVEMEASIAHWNLTPERYRTFKENAYNCNNAREDRIGEPKSMFHGALKARRCIIPATSYVEWTGPKGSKTEHDISHADGLLFMAGLWDRCAEGDSYTMVMMDAEGFARRFHDRMPVVLDRDTARVWLDVEANWREVIRAPGDGALIAHPPEPAAP